MHIYILSYIVLANGKKKTALRGSCVFSQIQYVYLFILRENAGADLESF